ncbi:hypothetical protein Asd1617_02767 [Shigella dysenteriae 1617]|uniref:Uncharacterized protein n=1 Tax=Shigella dysenteriae 1617 TaxID=754093 RepID=A0A0A6ZUQ1_SHIDY|nr:hypothetical protein Asd1617_02767 [Shigella dysenteriae 1617]
MPIIRTHCGLLLYFRSVLITNINLQNEAHSLKWLSPIRYI